MDAKTKELIQYLSDGKEKAKKQVEIEIDLNLYRNQITEILLQYKLPIGSNAKGYFLINSQEEFESSIKEIDKRIDGLLKRKDAITIGWDQRKRKRTIENLNYPKENKFH
ncbi:MAG: hypothetical protein ABSA76_08875 [Bacteroidales bacterium]